MVRLPEDFWIRIARGLMQDVVEGYLRAWQSWLRLDQAVRKCPCGHSLANHEVWPTVYGPLWACVWQVEDGGAGCPCAVYLFPRDINA
jgi:hypothetical protein